MEKYITLPGRKENIRSIKASLIDVKCEAFQLIGLQDFERNEITVKTLDGFYKVLNFTPLF